MNSQVTTCSLFTIYVTFVTLEQWFPIVSWFFLYLASHHQNKWEGKKGWKERKIEMGGAQGRSEEVKRKEEREQGRKGKKKEERRQRGQVKPHKGLGQEVQEYCHVSKTAHQQSLGVEM